MSLARQFQRFRQRNASEIVQEGPGPPIELQRIGAASSVVPPPVSNGSETDQAFQSRSESEPISQTSPRLDSCTASLVNSHHGSTSLVQSSLIGADTIEASEALIPATANGSLDTSLAVPSTTNTHKHVMKHTVEVKTQNKIIMKFLTKESTSFPTLMVNEVEEFEDDEAESKYQKFADFIRTAHNDLARPENDPLRYFMGRWIVIDKVMLQSSEANTLPQPYIRFAGPKNEHEVKILHSSLSKKTFRRHYYPPLKICYALRRAVPLKFGANDAILLRHIDFNYNSSSDQAGSIFDFEIQKDDYDDDIEAPLIVDSKPSNDGIIFRAPRIELFETAYEWMLRTFWAVEMDVAMLGLQGCGKTSLLRVLSGGEFTIDSIPTVGFNMKRVQKGHVTLKIWDLGGQPRFRSMWERYCRGVNAIVFVVDASDLGVMPIAKEELHELLKHPSLEGIPLLVLGNKSHRQDKLSVVELIEQLDLKFLGNREVSCYGISAKEETNLDAVLQWLISR
ncbi:ADP-ribosylation factor family protein [Phlyctema vagabunda]|uniref:ADP-ribosylation factor family protein n=1 Tax=Phlyctema vagabunda TaxID=108571 RepID=A0ABR4P481_9HELO